MDPTMKTTKHIPYLASEDFRNRFPYLFGIPRVRKITQNAEFIKLIESAFEGNEINLSKIYEQISPGEIREFIFKTKGKFVEDIFHALGFRCLEFFKVLCLNEDELGKLFGGTSTISTLLVLELNSSQLPQKEKRRILSMLFDLNEEGLKKIVSKVGNSSTTAILKKIQQRADREKMLEFLDEGNFSESSEDDESYGQKEMSPVLSDAEKRKLKEELYAPFRQNNL